MPLFHASAARLVPAAAVLLAFAGGKLAAQSFNTGVNVATQTASATGGEPPDTMGAVGPRNYVQFNNGFYRVFNKDGSPTAAAVSDTTFWQNAGLSNVNSLSDPRIVYDPASRRWFACMITVNEATNNRILIARSNSDDPSAAPGNWRAVTVQTALGAFRDYPTLGVNADGVAVGTINFPSGGGTNVSLVTIPKPDLLLATPSAASATVFDSRSQNTFGFLVQPVVNFNSPPGAGQMPVLASSNINFSQFVRSTVTGTTGPGAAWAGATNINITNYGGFPPNAQQPGTSTTLDSIDDRFGSNVIQVGNLIYAVNTIPVSGRAAVRFTVINETTNAVVHQQNITLAGGDLIHPSVAVNPSGDVVIGFTQTKTTAPTQFASAGVVVGSTTTFTNWTFTAPTVVFAGAGVYGGTRWGDYSATTVDPADPGVFWTPQEYTPSAGSTVNYATRATEIIPVKAGESRWAAAASGQYLTGSPWFNGTVPGPDDHAIFSRSGAPFTVTFTASATAGRASVRQGTTTFSVPAGATYTLSGTSAIFPSLAVAEFQGTAALTLRGGGSFSTVNTSVAAAAGGTGSVTLADAGAAWSNSAGLFVGGSSAAAGGTGSVALGTGTSATVGGTTTLWQTSSALTVTAAAFTTGGLSNPNGTSPTVTISNPAVGRALTVSGGAGTTFSGRITGTGGVTKSGTGTWTVSGGSNDFTGGTEVTGGVLAVRNTAGNGLGAGPVTVTNGSTLAVAHPASGAATAGGLVTVTDGSLRAGLAPGDAGLGVLSAGVSFGATGRYNWSLETETEAPAAAGTDYSQLRLTGGTTSLAAGSAIDLDFSPATTPSAADPFWQATRTWTVLDVTGTGSNAAVFTTVIDGTFAGVGVFTMLLGTGGDMNLVFTPTPIPEPACVLGVALITAVAVRRRRRG